MNDNFLPAKGIVVWARITGSGTWPALVLRRTVYSSSHAWRVRVFGIHPKLPENEVDLSTSSLECFVSQLHRYKHHSNSEAIRAACQFLSSDASNCFQRAAFSFATSRSRKSRNSITAKRPRGLVQSSSVANGGTANRILPLRPAPPTLPPNSAGSHNSASVVSTSSLSVQPVKQPSSATNNSLGRIASKVSKPLNKPSSETCVPVPHQNVPSVLPSSNHGGSGGSIRTNKPTNRAPEQNKRELPRKITRAVNLAPRPPPPPAPAISKNNSDGSQMINANYVGAAHGQFNPTIRPPPPPPMENKGTNLILAKTPGQPPQPFQSFTPTVPSSSIIGASSDEKIGTASRDTADTRLQPCQPSQNSKPVTPSSCETIAEEKNQVKRKPAKIMPKPVRHPQNTTPVDPSSSTVGTTARGKTATCRKPAKIRPKPTQQNQNPTPVVPSSSIVATAPVEKTAPSRKCGKIALKPAQHVQNSNLSVPSSSIARTSRVEKGAATNLKRAKTLLPRPQPSSDMHLSVPALSMARTSSVVEKVTATGVKLAQTTQNSAPFVPTSSSMTTSRAEKAAAVGVQFAQPNQNSTPAAPSAPLVGAPVVENAAASIANQSNAKTSIVQHSTQPIENCMAVVTKLTLVETSAGEKSIAIEKQHTDTSAQPSQSTDNSIPTNDGTSAMDKSIAESQDPSKTSVKPNEDGPEKRTVNRIESMGISIEPKRRNSEKKMNSVMLLEKEGPRTREELERIARWMRMRIMTNGLDEEVVALARGGNVPLPIPAYESNRSEVLTIRKKYVPRAKREAKNAKKRGENVRLKKTVVPVGVEKIVTATPLTERSDAEKKRMIM